MSFILRPVARASSSTRSLARTSVCVVPRRSLHAAIPVRKEALEVPTLLSATLPDEPEVIDPLELERDNHVKLPASIDPSHPYAERRLATANLIRAPSDLDKTSYKELSAELLLLRGNDSFFQNFYSPLLWDTLSAVQTKDQFRESLELIKIWRMQGGPLDWRIGMKLVELSIEHKTPLWALQALRNPTTFGVHVYSPAFPPYPSPTSIEPLSEADAFWMHTTALADADARDLKYHFKPDLPRENPYIQLPPSHPMVTDADQLHPIREGVPEPEALRVWLRALLVDEAESSGVSRELTTKEATFLHWIGNRFFPNDLTVTANYLTYLRSQTQDEKGTAYRRFLHMQNDLGLADRLVPAKEGVHEEDTARVDALIASADEWSGTAGEGWPVYARTKALLEGKTVEIVDPHVVGDDRKLGHGMGGLIGEKAE